MHRILIAASFAIVLCHCGSPSNKNDGGTGGSAGGVGGSTGGTGGSGGSTGGSGGSTGGSGGSTGGSGGSTGGSGGSTGGGSGGSTGGGSGGSTGGGSGGSTGGGSGGSTGGGSGGSTGGGSGGGSAGGSAAAGCVGDTTFASVAGLPFLDDAGSPYDGVRTNWAQIDAGAVATATNIYSSGYDTFSGNNGDVSDSWYAAGSTCAADTGVATYCCSGALFYQVTFPADATVAIVELRGNRDFASYNVLRGHISLINNSGTVLGGFNVETDPNTGDFLYQLPSPLTVRTVRLDIYTAEAGGPGLAELIAWGT